jgi:diguanylate cyclase (GGDEF)-like protein
MFASYAQLAASLVRDCNGACLLGGELDLRGASPGLVPDKIQAWLRQLDWSANGEPVAASTAHGRGAWLTAVPLLRTDGSLLGAFCVLQPRATAPTQPARHAAALALELKPLLDCVHRNLAAEQPPKSRLDILTERTAELEWLFKITSTLKGAADDRRLLEELLAAATERLSSAYGVISVPEKRVFIEHRRDLLQAAELQAVWTQTQPHLIAWAQRQHRPLIINGAGRGGKKLARCKILSVPVMRDNGRVLGVMAFYNAADAPDFASRQEFLARHLGRQTATLVDAQFDLMTGLYTRAGIEQMYAGFAPERQQADCSVLYVDIDHMHVVNEIHGFELGNELVVRVAELLSPPLVPEGALAARISGDRFAVVLPGLDPRAAADLAARIQGAATGLRLGTAQALVDVSISCGVAALVAMPQGFARAMAAAELACKTAKGRGRGRVELYACEDDSMMRRHDDALAVGQLRAALREDRLVLYAQRIFPLRNRNSRGGYELLLRMRNEDGTLTAPGPLILAAQRYQLLPSVDRWVIGRALQMLGPYRGMLKSRGLSMSINVSGQSIGEESCVQHFKEQLRVANLPPGCITIEITEQAAVTNLARANDMIGQLRALGCRFALDDFGTGANSLTLLKNLQISRVKIDGSFIRDILTDQNSLATVKAIVELAKALSIETVAEYVESDAIAQAVRRLGVDYAQGYAFGKPEPLDALLEGLDKDESARLRRLFLEL